VWVDSEPHEGSTFHFTARFGISDARPEALTWDVEGLRALVVDDNAVNRKVLETWLEQWGMQPVAVDSGPDALAALADAVAEGRPFTLVLLDAKMPQMDGFAVARHLQTNRSLGCATVMMLSSSGIGGESIRCRELGIAQYLTKPVEPRELLASIGRALARTQPAQNAILPPAMLAAPLPARRLRILVAEDNVVNQRVAAGILEKIGHEVTIASNGKEALAALERSTFDLILMDIQMPEMNGFEATAAIRAREEAEGGHIPIIAMTAHALKEDRQRSLDSGMDDYISKPLDALRLYAVVDAAGPQTGRMPIAV
jgi:CheY-like chemotaxis protein